MKRGIICQRCEYWLVGSSSAPLARDSVSEMGRVKREQPDTGVVAPSSVTVLGWCPAAALWAMVEARVWLRFRVKKARRASSCSSAPILSARSMMRGKWCPSP